MPHKRKKKNSNWFKYTSWSISTVLLIALIIVIALFLTGVWEFPISTQQTLDTTKIIEKLELGQTINEPGVICTLNMGKSIACVGEDVTSTINDGPLKRCVVAYDYEDTGWAIYSIENLDVDGFVSVTDSSGVAGTYIWTALCGYFEGENFIAECRTNDETIEIIICDDEPPEEPPEDEPLQPGDVVGSGGANVVLGVDSLSEFEIQLIPGDYQVDLCAEIERRSSKVDPNCNPTGDLEDWNNFIFLDSYTTVWTREDQIVAGVSVGPDTYGNPDIVPVRWNGVNPFHGFLHHFGDCTMNMEIRVTIVVC